MFVNSEFALPAGKHSDIKALQNLTISLFMRVYGMLVGMKNKEPRVSVVMPVYNAEKYVKGAIESILKQTYPNIELIIVNDASTDSSRTIIEGYQDDRIILINNEKNLKIQKSLNIGFKRASGRYIARMDSDDISLPTRIQVQVRFMESNPEVDICGTFLKRFNGRHDIWKYPTKDADIKAAMFYFCPLGHPTVMLRSESLKNFNLSYAQKHYTQEDYEFWIRSAEYLRFANIPEPLLLYRHHPEQVTKQTTLQELPFIQQKLFDRMGLRPSEEEIEVHKLAVFPNRLKEKPSLETLKAIEQWLNKLNNHNKSVQCYNTNSLTRYTQEAWYNCCKKSTKLGLDGWKVYKESALCLQDKKMNLILYLRCLGNIFNRK